MISRTGLNERVREWGLREDVIEKDYIIGWSSRQNGPTCSVTNCQYCHRLKIFGRNFHIYLIGSMASLLLRN